MAGCTILLPNSEDGLKWARGRLFALCLRSNGKWFNQLYLQMTYG